MTSEQANIPLAKDVHTFSSSVTPITSTWASAKVTSNRLTDTHAHVSLIQTSSISNPVFTTKSDNRSSKVSHVSKAVSAFTQQPAFPISSYEASVVSVFYVLKYLIVKIIYVKYFP